VFDLKTDIAIGSASEAISPFCFEIATHHSGARNDGQIEGLDCLTLFVDSTQPL
jgi:hypothetical protein